VANDAVDDLTQPLAGLQPVPNLGEPALQGRLLDPLSPPPPGNALLTLLHEIVGDLPGGSALRWHGWEREPGAARGIALALTNGPARAVLALSPGPFVDLVVTPGANLSHSASSGVWQVTASVSTPSAWQAEWQPGQAGVVAVGTASVSLTRDAVVTLGVPPGPGVSWKRLSVGIKVSPGTPAAVDVDFTEFVASVLPDELMGLLGGGQRPTPPSDLKLLVDRAEGLRFGAGGLRFPLPGGLDLPGLEARGLAVELLSGAGGLQLRPSLSVTAALPGLPIRMTLDGLGVLIPLTVDGGRLGVDPGAVEGVLPEGIGVELAMAPISGGGFLRQKNNQFGGILDIDLGAFQVQAMGLLDLPNNGRPLSFLVLLSGGFPPPGVQLGFGFALDAVGGLLGINHRVDTESLRGLVADGNADRVMFPDHALARAEEILGSLAQCFPVAPGHHVTGPMLQLNWGGRLVRVAVAVLLELPDPVRVIILGRAVISIPDPEVALIRLQASLFGRIDPAVPMIEVLVSLTGSHVAGIPISGDIYALFRGGNDPVFVLSAGGFHPRYTRPAGVPALRRLSMDLGGGFLGLRGEAYLALTSNSLQFGAMIHLDATIAGCGVEGHLGLDALFVWEPVVAFSVQVQAGVAVLAFGTRLASVGLRFTLEGPGAWHAFGTGSISVLWWDVDLDFDVRWGTPPALTRRPPDILDAVTKAVARAENWSVAPPATARSPIQLAPWAAREVAAGKVALPESGLRVSQEVVPLDVPFNRFHRIGVPEQTWRLAQVRLNPRGNPVPPGREVTARFVPGEYWALTDDEQLGRAAFEERRSGAELSDTIVQPGETRDADERYETAYEVDDAWFPPQPPEFPRWIFALANFRLEGFSRILSGAERADQWRHEQLRISAVPLVRLQ
jgi:hypothetical protein